MPPSDGQSSKHAVSLGTCLALEEKISDLVVPGLFRYISSGSQVRVWDQRHQNIPQQMPAPERGLYEGLHVPE